MSENKKMGRDWYTQLNGLRGKVRKTTDSPVVDPDLITGTANLDAGGHRETIGLTQEQVDEFASNQMHIQKATAAEKRSAFYANCAITLAAIIGTAATAYGAYRAANHKHTSV